MILWDPCEAWAQLRPIEADLCALVGTVAQDEGRLGQLNQPLEFRACDRCTSEWVVRPRGCVGRVIGRVQIDPGDELLQFLRAEAQRFVCMPTDQGLDQAALVRAPGVGGEDLCGAAADAAEIAAGPEIDVGRVECEGLVARQQELRSSIDEIVADLEGTE